MRLQNYIKNNLGITKSELMALYNDKKIFVNGKLENLSFNLKEEDIVTVNNKIIENKEYRYYLYNKKIGIVCTNDMSVNDNIRSYLNLDIRVYPIGRLDKMSHGLMILSNDGKLTHELLSPNSHVEKEYVVKVEKAIDNNFISKMEESYLIDHKMTKQAKAYLIDDYTFGIILKEGRNHQIRTMVKLNSNKVIDLYRIRIANFTIDDLKGNELLEVKDLKNILK